MRKERLTFSKKCGTCGGMCAKRELNCPKCRNWLIEYYKQRKQQERAHQLALQRFYDYKKEPL